MDVLLTHDLHAVCNGRGKFLTNGNTWYETWKKYLAHFDHVHVLARVRRMEVDEEKYKPLDGEGVSIIGLEEFGVGPLSWLRIPGNAVVARRAMEMPCAAILRAGLIANFAYALKTTGRPFALEVAGDPADAFSEDSFRHPLRPVIRAAAVRMLNAQCQQAIAVSYVTERALQASYPASPGAYATHCSSIDLDESCFAAEPKACAAAGGAGVKIICVANFYQAYKGQDDLLEAVRICRERGLDIRLALIGGGKLLERTRARAATMGLGEVVEFPGVLPPGKAVRERLDRADLFVLASRTEGLPRSMIEAMARGLPCIGTEVGGIPELLPERWRVPPGRPEALAGKIEEALESKELRREMGVANLAKSREYSTELLGRRRMEFFAEVSRRTVDWLKGRGRA